MYIKDGFLYFDDEQVKPKEKISGHTFVELCGFSDFNLKGEAVLSHLKLFKREVDKGYMIRGEYAENLVGAILSYNGRTFIHYSEEEKKKNNYDFFLNDKDFGGIPDYLMTDISETIEVKTKTMNKYDWIAVKGNIPKEELYQGLLYGEMDNKDFVRMYYVFLDDESNDLLMNGKKPYTLTKLKFYDKQYDMNIYRDEVKKLKENAKTYLKTCISEKRIPLKDIKKQVLMDLRVLNE